MYEKLCAVLEELRELMARSVDDLASMVYLGVLC